MIEGYADVCPTTSRGTARRPKMTPESVRPGGGGHWLGKTRSLAERDREVTEVAP